MTLLSVSNLTKSFGGIVANDSVSFDLNEGDIYAVIGPNGAGKTTLFNLISGVLRPTSGSVQYAGRDITGLAQADIAALGVVRTYQLVQLFRQRTVEENVQIGFHLATRGGVGAALFRPGWVRRQERMVREKSRELLRLVGLESQAGLVADKLPYGQQRLLKIARAMAAGPKLLMLDEPAAGLDTQETSVLGDVIQRINDQGITIVLIEHDMNLVMRMATRITVLDFGKKIAEGTPVEVKVNPAVLAAYLGEAELE
ncbi:MAG: ABC transporter ATP-binding protein [Proteobacteria bacterium]|nr:ABC transporter ATP-binding protein [Pseudomonadota bacterium]